MTNETDLFDQFTFEYIETIPESKLKEVWQKFFSDKPFPKVKGFMLTEQEYLRVLKKEKEFPNIKDLRVEEWKTYRKDEESNAHTCSVDDNYKGEYKFIILRKETSTESLEHNLEHELGHIYRKEV